MTGIRKWFSFRYSLRTLAILIIVYSAGLAGVVQFKQFQREREAELRQLEEELNRQGHRIDYVGYFFGEPRLMSQSPYWFYDLLDWFSVHDVSFVWYEKSLSDVEPATLARIARSVEYVSLKDFESLDDETVKRIIGPRTTHLDVSQSRCSEKLFHDLQLYARIKELLLRDAVIPADPLEQIAKLPRLEKLVIPAHRESLAWISTLQCRDRLKQLHVIVYPEESDSNDTFDGGDHTYFVIMPPAPTEARHLQFLAGCEHLEWLTFDGPLCTSAIQYIVAQCPRLETIEMRNSIIELEGMEALLSLGNLRVLRFKLCHVTEEAVSAAAVTPHAPISSDVARDYIERDDDSFYFYPPSAFTRRWQPCGVEHPADHIP
jgi:hypothetical protein